MEFADFFMGPSDKIKGALPGCGKTGELSLHEAEIKYRTLFEQSPYGILTIGTDGRILDFNESAHRDLGYTREEFSGLSIAGIDPEESADDVQARIRHILKEGAAQFDVVHLTKQGERRDVHVIIKPLVLSGQTVLHCIWRDITERKKGQEALRRSEERFRLAMSGATDGLWDWDLKTQEMYYSPRWKSMLGYSDHELENNMGTWERLLHPDDRASSAAFIKDFLEGYAGKFELEFRLRHKDGSYRDILSRAFLVHDDDGRPARLAGTHVDVTERRRIEERLRKEAERNRVLLEMYEKAAHLTDNELYESVLAQAVRITDSEIGFFHALSDDQDSIVLTTWDKKTMRNCSVPEPKHYPVDQAGNWVDCVRLGRPVVYNDYQTSPNRKGLPEGHVPLRRFMSIPVIEDGKVRFIFGVGNKTGDYEEHDMVQLQIVAGELHKITAKRRSDEALRRSEEFIRNILDTVDEGFVVIGRDMKILAANRAFCAWNDEAGSAHGRPVLGRHCYEISHKKTRPCDEDGELCAVKRVFETGKPQAAMHKHEDAKGNILYVETKAFPMRDAEGRVTSAIETIHNITERHLLEEQQLKSQKLEAIGTLAGGIAHDFRNLLQGVFGYISLAKMDPDKGKSLAALEQAEKALNLSINLTNQLLTFSKGGKPVKKRLDVLPVVESAVKFALSGSRSYDRLEYDPGLWPVEADEGQIAQVIQNIVLNAHEAMPGGGPINISVRNVRACTDKMLPGEGKFVSIVIEDSGAGIPRQHISRIFDPYFTTKQRGSGLGLATSYSIIKNHGGLIDVRSEEGKGSAFSICLPASEDRTERAAQSIIPAPWRKGKVLVMDDEEIVRDVVSQMLQTIGHEVVCTENGEEAIEKLREATGCGRKNIFDAAILDLTVKGGMGGEQVAAKLAEIDPDIKIIVSSGYSDSSIVSNYRAYGFSASLSKPYTIEVLKETLNSLLHRP